MEALNGHSGLLVGGRAKYKEQNRKGANIDPCGTPDKDIVPALKPH